MAPRHQPLNSELDCATSSAHNEISLMKRDALENLASDPRFISGVYNYCDRWCERCPLSNRCLNYAMEEAEDDGDPASRDITNGEFWKKIEQNFRDTMEMVVADAKERGIDLDSPDLRAEVMEQERQERRLAAKNKPLAKAAMAYLKNVDKWFGASEPAFKAKGVELETLARIEVGDPQSELVELKDYVDVIRWYQTFIYPKLNRAISSQANEQLETDEELKAFPKDSDGSAKIALISIDRSIAAWSGLRSALGADHADTILDLLAQLAAIRRATEKLFPNARAFVRPGFDDRPSTAKKKC